MDLVTAVLLETSDLPRWLLTERERNLYFSRNRMLRWSNFLKKLDALYRGGTSNVLGIAVFF
jgi:hypothetical protein